jgi:hypothetical protein
MKTLKSLLLSSLLMAFPVISAAQEIQDAKALAGSWLGNLEIGAISLRIVFNINYNGSDSLSATMDSPDQGAKNIPLGKTTLRGDSLRIEAPLLSGNYRGAAINDTTIDGKWTQRGQSFPLKISKLRSGFSINRPQEPKPPFPYSSVEVSIPNRQFNIFLSGTLTLPKGEGPFPAAILITGSGAQNRDEALMGHKPFMVIADWLTRNGIAVLRYDDRGVGKSQGNYAAASTADLATDALAAFNFLKSHPAVNHSFIGMIGRSEGGLIAPIAASSEPAVAFIIALAGTGVTGEQILYRQQADISRLSGVSESDMRFAYETNRKLYAVLKKEKDNLKAEKKILEVYSKILEGQKISPEETESRLSQLKASFGSATYPWFRYFITTDPAKFWSRVKCPVLALNGEKDMQVAAGINLPAIEKAVKSGGNNNVKTVSFPSLNHLFQHCTTGLPSEYGKIEETFSPEALKTMSDWILGLKVSR